MVAVKVANEYPRHNRRSYIGKDELPLSPFAWIEEKTFVIPTDEISAVIAETGGLLAGAS